MGADPDAPTDTRIFYSIPRYPPPNDWLLFESLTPKKKIFPPIIYRITLRECLNVVKLKEILRKNIAIYMKNGRNWPHSSLDSRLFWTHGRSLAVHCIRTSVRDAWILLYVFGNSFCQRSVWYGQWWLDPVAWPLLSDLIGQIAPYMSFKQVQYVLLARPGHDWAPNDLARIHSMYSMKNRVLDILEWYWSLWFLPQSFLLSVFLGEATRASLRARA